MSKYKIVCVIGSAVLAPIIATTLTVAFYIGMLLIDSKWPIPGVPHWMRWIGLPCLVLGFSYWIYRAYCLLFRHCYAPNRESKV